MLIRIVRNYELSVYLLMTNNLNTFLHENHLFTFILRFVAGMCIRL